MPQKYFSLKELLISLSGRGIVQLQDMKWEIQSKGHIGKDRLVRRHKDRAGDQGVRRARS